MKNETRYGVISDIHQDPRIIIPTIKILKNNGIDKLLINGDIGERQQKIEDTQRYTAFILNAIGESGLESYVQPGSHETLLGFQPVLDHFTDKYSNIIDATKNPKTEEKNHDLVFLPGSDFLCGGEYQIENNEKISTNIYAIGETGIRPIDLETYLQIMSDGQPEKLGLGQIRGIKSYNNMGDLQKLVNEPNKSIVVCHIPRKFDNPENCVDMAHFHQQRAYYQDFEKNPQENITYTEISIMPGVIPRKRIAQQGIQTFGLEDSEEYITQKAKKIMNKEKQEKIVLSVERKENRGNKDLRLLYQELGINKAISGHFHESGHRANDSRGNKVLEGKITNDLFWNSGHLDAGQTGILNVGDEGVQYQNINLQDYL
jgi:predicted phosphodiesterase